VLLNDRRFVIFDLVSFTRRDGPALELEGDLGGVAGSIKLGADTITSVSRERVIRWSRKDGSVIGDRVLPPNKGGYLDGDSLLLLPLSSLGHGGFDIISLDIASGDTKVVAHFERDSNRFPLGNDPHGWVVFGGTGTIPTITIWAGGGLTMAQVFTFDLGTGTLGRDVPWAAAADGEFLAEPSFSNPVQPGDAVIVTKVETGEQVLRCLYEPGDSPRTGPAAFDLGSRNVAAAVGDSQIAVWRPGARRLFLSGHRGTNALLVRSNSVVAWDRFWIRLWDITGD
jgi:hypothetical protein